MDNIKKKRGNDHIFYICLNFASLLLYISFAFFDIYVHLNMKFLKKYKIRLDIVNLNN